MPSSSEAVATATAGVGRTGVDCIGVARTGVDCIGVARTGVDCIGVARTGVDCAGVARTGVDCTGVARTGVVLPVAAIGVDGRAGMAGIDMNGVGAKTGPGAWRTAAPVSEWVA